LQHEFYHLKRHDHRFNFLRAIVKSLFWFNPMFYWADKYCEADQELSCDLGVLQNSDIDKRTAYANALLATFSGNTRSKLVSQWKYQSLIKERVRMLKNNTSKKWHSWAALALAASAIWGTSSVVMAEREPMATSAATPTSIVQPRYPRKAAEEGLEGWVKFEFNVDSNGHPYEVKLTAADPINVFERDAKKAIYQWRFEKNKAQNNLVYTMQFKLADPSEE
jgi:TonB family protein